jgi:uncharacterized membrane protein
MSTENVNSRLEAFCDGVFAIALTLLIIEIRIPPSVTINSTSEFWLALEHIAPLIFAFLLSFVVIFITWVNHHSTLKLVNKTSHPFIYANGLFLLSVVIIPFPTTLLGEYLLTDHASPAVILYCAVCGFQAVGWNFLTRTALGPVQLTRNEKAAAKMRENHKYSYFAFTIYTICAVTAIWFPLTIAIIISLIWIIWLIVGINLRSE